MRTSTWEVGVQMIPSPVWALRMCGSQRPGRFFMTSWRLTLYMHILGPSKDSWGPLYGFLELFFYRVPSSLKYTVSPQPPPGSDSLNFNLSEISMLCWGYLSLLFGLGWTSRQKTRAVMGHASLVFLFSWVSLALTDSCSMSEKSCFVYFVQSSSCLRWKRNLVPLTSSRPNGAWILISALPYVAV